MSVDRNAKNYYGNLHAHVLIRMQQLTALIC